MQIKEFQSEENAGERIDKFLTEKVPGAFPFLYSKTDKRREESAEKEDDGCGRYETLGGCRRISGTAEGGILYDCFVICRGGVVDFCIAQKKKSKDKAVVLLFLYSKAAEWCLGAISE